MDGHVHEFIGFVADSNFINVALAFLISTNVQQLISSVVNNIINPILRKFLKLENLTFTVWGVTFMLGPTINGIITFTIVLYFFFLLFRSLGIKPQAKK